MAKKYYAVKQGRVPGIYLTWSDCEKQVKGFSGAIYTSFTSKEEAQTFMAPVGAHGTSKLYRENTKDTDNNSNININSNSNSNIASNTHTVSLQPSADELVAYIDGSFDKRLGTVGAGGIMFTSDGENTFSFGTKDPQFTEFWNVAGELLAAMHVMQYAVDHHIRSCHLYYDYMGIEMWATKQWKRNNALTRGYAEFYESIEPKLSVHFHKVAAHTGDQYNEVADQLAKAGTKNV